MKFVRHLATNYAGTILAAAEFESIVHIWNLRTLGKIRTIETTLDFGGRRLAISPNGKTIAVGAWARHGIALYRVSDGAELWRRKDLTNVQYLNFSHKRGTLWSCHDKKPAHHLDFSSGETIETARDVKEIWESPVGAERLIQPGRGNYLLTNGKSKVSEIHKATFSALSAAFSDSKVCLSEAGGPVRLFDLASGNQIWRHDPPQNTHFLEVAFSTEVQKFMGVSWEYQTGGQHVLNHFDESGAAHPVSNLDSKGAHITAFCLRGTRIVTGSGAIVDTRSGKPEAQLPF